MNLLQPSIVSVPGDDRNTEVTRQLEEVLGAGGGSAIPREQIRSGGEPVGVLLLRVCEVDDGGAPLVNLAAEEVQHVCREGGGK